MPISIPDVQQAIKEFDFDGWLLYDFRGANPLARRILDLESGGLQSRRWFYFVPKDGEPIKLVHRIEADTLSHLPGKQIEYLSRFELADHLKQILSVAKKIAMEYAPMGNNPYISRVDAGTIELVKSMGVEPDSSGDLVQKFEAVLSPGQWDSHLKASDVTLSAFHKAWNFIKTEVTSKGSIDEISVLQCILDHFKAHNCVTYSPPIVAVNGNAGLPHYETGQGKNIEIRLGDTVLIDMWCKLDEPQSIYSDITKMAYVGDHIPEEKACIFQHVINGRDASLNLVREAFKQGTPLKGYET